MKNGPNAINSTNDSFSLDCRKAFCKRESVNLLIRRGSTNNMNNKLIQSFVVTIIYG